MQRFLRWCNNDDKDDEFRYSVSLNVNCCSHDNTNTAYVPPEQEDTVDNGQFTQHSKKDILRPKASGRLRKIGRSCCCIQIEQRRCKELAYTSTDVHTSQVQETDL